MFGTNQVGKLADNPAASNEVAELSCAVKGRRIPVNMIVNVRFVNVGTNNKCVIPLSEAFSEFITNTVRLLGRNLSRLERLPYLISYNIAFLNTSAQLSALSLGQSKFGNHGIRVAGKSRDQLTTKGEVVGTYENL